MIRVKTFTSQLKIFHAKNELEDLDRAVNEFIASGPVKSVVSVGDAVTTGEKGEAIGVIRVLAYEEGSPSLKETYLERLEAQLKEWGGEIEPLRRKAGKLGAQARAGIQGQLEELRERQETAGRKLQELKASGGGAWDELKAGAEGALDELKKGVESAVARFRKR